MFQGLCQGLGIVTDSEFLLPTVVGGMIRSAKGTVRVLPTADHWFGMT